MKPDDSYRTLKYVVFLIVGSILNGIGTVTFTASANVAPGGITGLAIMGNYIDPDGVSKAKYSVLAQPFQDEAKVSKWARNSVAWAYTSGLFSGSIVKGKKYIDPLVNVPRGRAATVLANAIKSGTLKLS